jgi:precorrin-3B methylase
MTEVALPEAAVDRAVDTSRMKVSDEVAIQITQMNKWFGAFHVLRDIDMTVYRGERIVIFARAVSTPDQQIETVELRDARPEMADMRTLVIVGNSARRPTRCEVVALASATVANNS